MIGKKYSLFHITTCQYVYLFFQEKVQYLQFDNGKSLCTHYLLWSIKEPTYYDYFLIRKMLDMLVEYYGYSEAEFEALEHV
jgi:hypothetical protein